MSILSEKKFVFYLDQNVVYREIEEDLNVNREQHDNGA
jgi:hypothetical protein